MKERSRERSIRKKSRIVRPQYTRREFLGIPKNVAIASGCTTVGGGAALWFLYFKEKYEISQKIQEYKTNEELLDPVIRSFETGFEAFAQSTNKKLEALRLSPQDKESLNIPFEVARINKENPEKNLHRVKRKDLETHGNLGSRTTHTQDPNYFLYEIHEDEGTVATYIPVSRTFRISLQYDPTNILDNAIGYHELLHVAQDTQTRSEIPQQVYFSFYSGKQRIVGIYEATAYAREIFVLNLFTNGQFRNDVAQGTFDTKKYLARLNARPEQESVLLLLKDMAYIYFSGRSSLSGIDSTFYSYIANLYRQRGFEVYDQTSSGFIPSRK